jgi:tetratricopeptide (TPR) repeat protein
MKKLINLFLILIFSASVYSQQSVEYLLKARANTEGGNADIAISILSKAVTELKDSRLYIERASANLIKGDYSGAISDYNEANKLTSSSGDYGLARVYALKGDIKTSLYHLERSMKSVSGKSEKYIMLDPAFASIENRPEWRQFWKKEWYSETDKGISEIEYYLSAGKPVEAISILSELKRSHPDNNEVIYTEALVLNETGKYSEAIKIVSALVEKNPENEKFLRLLAKVQINSSNPAGASLSYSRLIEAGVADAQLFVQRAGCYMKTREYEKALTDLEKYIGYYPGNKTGLSLAGKAAAASGDNIMAMKLFSENLKLHPNDADCYVDRANSYFVSKSWEWAINDYAMSLDLDPSNSEVWLNKGISRLNSGKTDDACHDFRKSFSMGNKRASEYISKNCIK